MSTQMSVLEVGAFFAETPRYVMISSLRRDGSPIVTAAGFEWDGTCVYFSMLNSRALIKRLRRDPRVGLLVANTSYPTAWVSLEGRADIIDDPGYATALRIMMRYMNPSEDSQGLKDIRLAEFAQNYVARGRTLFRVIPEKIVSRDARKLERPRHERYGTDGA